MKVRLLSGTVRKTGLGLVIPVLALSSLASLAYADEPTETEVALQLYHTRGAACDVSWQQEFQAANGQESTDQDCLDRVWSLRVTQIDGRTPTAADWQMRFYHHHPFDQVDQPGEE